MAGFGDGLGVEGVRGVGGAEEGMKFGVVGLEVDGMFEERDGFLPLGSGDEGEGEIAIGGGVGFVGEGLAEFGGAFGE